MTAGKRFERTPDGRWRLVPREGSTAPMATDTEPRGFDPRRHMRQLRGRGGGEYLDVKWRLVWLREDAPDSTIETEHVVLNESFALFRATVRRIVGGELKGSATGYGSETPGDFGDFIEKAETKAIGRALNALGYGAQHMPEDSAPETPFHGIDSAPVNHPQRQQQSAAPRPVAPPDNFQPDPDIHADREQRSQMLYFGTALNWTPDEMRERMADRYGGVRDSRRLTKSQAADFISWLEAQTDAADAANQTPPTQPVLDADFAPVDRPDPSRFTN